MIHDYYHYNSPDKGNKRMYAYGSHDSIKTCGFIHADTKAQAQTVLNANNRVWQDNCVLLDFTAEECRQELDRRKEEQCRTLKQ